MWSERFLTQARSDWQIYQHLEATAYPACHALHYLQMATEKLAKAYLLKGGTSIQDVRLTHRAFARYMLDLARNRRLQRVMGMHGRQLRALVIHLLPLASEIEGLAPAIAGDRPNPEYPWQSPDGAYHAPATYDFAVKMTLRLPSGHNLLKLLRIAIDNFELLHRG